MTEEENIQTTFFPDATSSGYCSEKNSMNMKMFLEMIANQIMESVKLGLFSTTIDLESMSLSIDKREHIIYFIENKGYRIKESEDNGDKIEISW